jgi:O-antigen/teichoic acid export membrane protein
MVLAISSLGALGLAIFGKFIIRVLLSKAFLGAYVPMLVLLPGVVLLGAGKILSADISGRGFPQYASIISGFSLVITITLDFLLIPRMGIIGAAVASSVSYAFIFALLIVFYYKTKNRN